MHNSNSAYFRQRFRFHAGLLACFLNIVRNFRVLFGDYLFFAYRVPRQHSVFGLSVRLSVRARSGRRHSPTGLCRRLLVYFSVSRLNSLFVGCWMLSRETLRVDSSTFVVRFCFQRTAEAVAMTSPSPSDDAD